MEVEEEREKRKGVGSSPEDGTNDGGFESTERWHVHAELACMVDPRFRSGVLRNRMGEHCFRLLGWAGAEKHCPCIEAFALYQQREGAPGGEAAQF